MNSQDFRSLQEAYMEVVENQQLGEDAGIVSGLVGLALGAKGAYNAAKKSKRMRDYPKNFVKGIVDPRTYVPKKKKEQKEEVDLYDIILSHLLDEGYAETQEQAEVIMVNMSEDWRESIMERRENDEPGEDDRNPDVRSHNRAVGYKSKPKQKYRSYDKRDRGGSEEDHEKSLGLQNLIRSVQGGSVKKSG
jgi:hypothetical protein